MTRPIFWVLVADLWWGISALFWRELDTVMPADQLGWRITTGLLLLLAFAAVQKTNPFAGMTQRKLAFGVGGALFIFTNWAVFLWAISNGQAVDAALGYFLSPVVSVALAVRVLGERPRVFQAIAVAFALGGIVWMVVVQGRLPWVSLALGFSFAFYGLLRKTGPWEAVDGLTMEMALCVPLGAGLLLWRAAEGTAVTGDNSPRTWLLIALTGAVTTVPLALFAYAARRAPLIVVGLLQYIVPIAQFLVGWLAFGESVSSTRFIGFALVWVAVVLVVVDQIHTQVDGALGKLPVDGGEPNLG